MTSRERLIAISRGGDVDRKPVICWPVSCPESDAATEPGWPDQLRLTPVVNPFGQALRHQIPVWESLAEYPRIGQEILDDLVTRSRREIQGALEHGADGVLYLLFGARGIHATPMEYGGHYLERDRELLDEVRDATFNLVFVVGEDDAYLDFVSDLPAHAFGWDSIGTGISVENMRAMRSGALATNSLEADIELRFGIENVSSHLELELQKTHV